MLKRLIGRIQCRLFGHRRGRYVVGGSEAEYNGLVRCYRCPRCGATWERKIKAAEPKP